MQSQVRKRSQMRRDLALDAFASRKKDSYDAALCVLAMILTNPRSPLGGVAEDHFARDIYTESEHYQKEGGIHQRTDLKA